MPRYVFTSLYCIWLAIIINNLEKLQGLQLRKAQRPVRFWKPDRSYSHVVILYFPQHPPVPSETTKPYPSHPVPLNDYLV